jgi:hypothetical protein
MNNRMNFLRQSFRLCTIIAIVSLIAFSMAGCGGDSGGDTNYNFNGSWSGLEDGYYISVRIAGNSYSINIDSKLWDRGTFIQSGNTATITSNDSGSVGTATLVDSNTMKVTLYRSTGYGGVYALYRN